MRIFLELFTMAPKLSSMAYYTIQGTARLSGSVDVRGAKNGALKAIAAALLSDEPMRIEGIPDIEDTRRQVELVAALGATPDWNQSRHILTLTPANLGSQLSLDIERFGKLRASMALIGPMLARFGEAVFPDPGGCSIGMRPIDIFLQGFSSLGAVIDKKNNRYRITAPSGGLKGSRIVFSNISVVATETIMMAAVLAHGTTVLINAACEPEIPALAAYLNSVGARVSGAGTSTITIEGVSRLSGGVFINIPDRLEAAFWAVTACATQSNLTINRCNPEHLEVALTLLQRMGASLSWNDSSINVLPHHGLTAVNIKTHEYPGLATDVQPFLTVLLTQAAGQALVHETIFESRLAFAAELNRMGASLTVCDPHRIIIQGPHRLAARDLTCPDARAGTAFLIAALIAEGTSTLSNIYQLERGFEGLPERLNQLGAHIARHE